LNYTKLASFSIVDEGFVKGSVEGFVDEGFVEGFVEGCVDEGFVEGFVEQIVDEGFVLGFVEGFVDEGFVERFVERFVDEDLLKDLLKDLSMKDLLRDLLKPRRTDGRRRTIPVSNPTHEEQHRLAGTRSFACTHARTQRNRNRTESDFLAGVSRFHTPNLPYTHTHGA
jgi:hypothetical protein